MSKIKSALDSIWAMKYRTDNLNDTVLPDRLKNTFQKFIDDGDIPNMIFVSTSPGTGKTSIAKILTKELGATILEINGSQDRGIDVIRGTITNFVRNSSIMGGKKIVLVDEADGLTIQAQLALKSFIEEYGEIVRFIFTANDRHVFVDAITSRFQTIIFEVDDDEYKNMVNSFTHRVCSIFDD